jgi:hypothetical protein
VSAASFIASLVSSLAWPGVVVTIVLIFRRQFGTMLERLSRMRLGAGGGDADSDWGQAAAGVRQSLAGGRPELPGPGQQGHPGQPGHQGQQGRPGGKPPQALIEDRWHALTAELRDVVLRSGSVSDEQLASFGFDQLLEAALRAGLLDSATMRSLDGLRSLHNLARSGDGPDRLGERQAQEFAVLADAVSYTMRRDRRTAAWPAR